MDKGGNGLKKDLGSLGNIAVLGTGVLIYLILVSLVKIIYNIT